MCLFYLLNMRATFPATMAINATAVITIQAIVFFLLCLLVLSIYLHLAHAVSGSKDMPVGGVNWRGALTPLVN